MGGVEFDQTVRREGTMIRLVITLLGALLGVSSTSAAAITAFWVPVASGDGSVGSTYPAAATSGEFGDPALLGMQTWDLRVTTTGDWSEAGLRAVLPSGTFYRGTNTGIIKPEVTVPPREFWTYVTEPRDDVQFHLIVVGGFPEGQPVSNGTANGANIAGTFSCQWLNLTNEPPSPPNGYQIARLTFPLGVTPDVLTSDQNPANFSRVLQTGPISTAAIPEMPEPNSLGLVCLVSWVLRRGRQG